MSCCAWAHWIGSPLQLGGLSHVVPPVNPSFTQSAPLEVLPLPHDVPALPLPSPDPLLLPVVVVPPLPVLVPPGTDVTPPVLVETVVEL